MMRGTHDIDKVRNVEATVYRLKPGTARREYQPRQELEIVCQLDPFDPPLDNSGNLWVIATTTGAHEIEPGLFLELRLTRKRRL